MKMNFASSSLKMGYRVLRALSSSAMSYATARMPCSRGVLSLARPAEYKAQCMGWRATNHYRFIKAWPVRRPRISACLRRSTCGLSDRSETFRQHQQPAEGSTPTYRGLRASLSGRWRHIWAWRHRDPHQPPPFFSQ